MRCTTPPASGDVVCSGRVLDGSLHLRHVQAPRIAATSLRLPHVDRLEIMGVAGGRAHASVHAGRIEIAGMEMLARLVSFEDEVVIGRDVLNRLVAHLDGPGLRLRLS